MSTPVKPGRELDALVAEKVMGWNRSPAPSFDRNREILGPHENMTAAWSASWEPVGSIQVPRDILPHYSTDKSGAKQVIYAMADKPKEIQDRFFNAIGFSSPEVLSRQEDSTWTDTVDPLQVCLAALKAVGAI